MHSFWRLLAPHLCDRISMPPRARNPSFLAWAVSLSLGLKQGVSFLFDSLSNHVRQSNARLCRLPFVVVVMLHEITFEPLVINLAIFIETIVFGERNFTTIISTHTLSHVDRERARSV